MNYAKQDTRAFTLIEVTLAIGVVAIGLVAILALFPLGLRATRKADFQTEAALMGQDYIAYYQQRALSAGNYDNTGTPATVLQNENYQDIKTNLNGRVFSVRVVVTNEGFNALALNGTNLTSRVLLTIYPYKNGIEDTNEVASYVTEVARYVTQP